MLIENKSKVTVEGKGLIDLGQVVIGDRVLGKEGYNTVLGVRHSTVYPSLWGLDDFVTLTVEQPVLGYDGEWYAVNKSASQNVHPYLSVKQLKQGTSLWHKDGLVVADNLIGFPETPNVFCVELELDGDHTFVVNNLCFHNKGGGGSSGSTTTIQKTDPPAYLQPYLTDIAEQAQTAYNAVPKGGFSGQLVASPTTAQSQALAAQKGIAGSLANFGQPTLALSNDLATKSQSGYYTQPGGQSFTPTNIGTEAAVNAYLSPVKQQLTNEILPNLASNAIQQGAYGGSRYYTEMGNQIDQNYTQKAADIAAQIGYGEQVRQQDQIFQDAQKRLELMPELFKLEQTAALSAPGIADAGVSQLLTPSSILASAGQAEQLFNQDVLDEAYQQYLLDIAGPFAGLDQYASIVSGTPFGGTSTGTTTGAKPSGGSSFLSGALGGGTMAYGLASAIPSLGFLGGPIGIGAGAILGGLLGM